MGASDFETKDSGERAHFDSGMQRDTEDGKPRFDLMIPLDVPYEEQMITRLAALYGRGAVKYDARNWEQANSEEEIARMKSSAFRHFMQLICGETDEDHAAAVIFNIIAWQTIEYKMSASNALETPIEAVQAESPVRVASTGCVWSDRWLDCEEADCKKRNHHDKAERRVDTV